MYFLGNLGGWRGQEALWRFVNENTLLLHTSSSTEISRIEELMEKYQDVPMDLADASLVALAETTGLKKVYVRY